MDTLSHNDFHSICPKRTITNFHQNAKLWKLKIYVRFHHRLIRAGQDDSYRGNLAREIYWGQWFFTKMHANTQTEQRSIFKPKHWGNGYLVITSLHTKGFLSNSRWILTIGRVNLCNTSGFTKHTFSVKSGQSSIFTKTQFTTYNRWYLQNARKNFNQTGGQIAAMDKVGWQNLPIISDAHRRGKIEKLVTDCNLGKMTKGENYEF